LILQEQDKFGDGEEMVHRAFRRHCKLLRPE
jgi:hypothetical protein